MYNEDGSLITWKSTWYISAHNKTSYAWHWDGYVHSSKIFCEFYVKKFAKQKFCLKTTGMNILPIWDGHVKEKHAK